MCEFSIAAAAEIIIIIIPTLRFKFNPCRAFICMHACRRHGLINKWAACALAHTRSEISFQLALAASRAMTLSEIALWRRCFAESERLNCRCLSLTMVFGKSDLLRHHGPTLVLIMWQRLQLKPPELNHNMLLVKFDLKFIHPESAILNQMSSFPSDILLDYIFYTRD